MPFMSSVCEFQLIQQKHLDPPCSFGNKAASSYDISFGTALHEYCTKPGDGRAASFNIVQQLAWPKGSGLHEMLPAAMAEANKHGSPLCMGLSSSASDMRRLSFLMSEQPCIQVIRLLDKPF